MIFVTKEEATELRKLFPTLMISRTMKQHSGKRGKRYAPETREILNFLRKSRDVNYIATEC
jgi:hypothetical protein